MVNITLVRNRLKHCYVNLTPALIIKPNLHLVLKRGWFYKILNGSKTVEYREVKPYWTKRIGGWVGRVCKRGNPPKYVMFRSGYTNTGTRILAEVYDVKIVNNPMIGWNGQYYALSFRVVNQYSFMNGQYYTKEFKKK